VPSHESGRNSGRISAFNKWMRKIDVDDYQSLEEHFLALINSLNDSMIESLHGISQYAKVVVEVDLVHEVGIEIPNDVLAILSRCGASIEIDVRD
jgi:hypothetical protein